LQKLYNLVPKVDKIIIGGGMAFTFLKALGYEVGNSLVEDDLILEATKIMEQAKELGVKFYLPVDVVVAESFDEESFAKATTVQEIPKNWMGLDIGPATALLFAVASSYATTVVGGGDTADLVRVTGDEDDMTFISTGGGASLELIEGKILPGVKALVIEG
jgi:phosphoglycerate kinase